MKQFDLDHLLTARHSEYLYWTDFTRTGIAEDGRKMPTVIRCAARVHDCILMARHDWPGEDGSVTDRDYLWLFQAKMCASVTPSSPADPDPVPRDQTRAPV